MYPSSDTDLDPLLLCLSLIARSATPFSLFPFSGSSSEELSSDFPTLISYVPASAKMSSSSSMIITSSFFSSLAGFEISALMSSPLIGRGGCTLVEDSAVGARSKDRSGAIGVIALDGGTTFFFFFFFFFSPSPVFSSCLAPMLLNYP